MNQLANEPPMLEPKRRRCMQVVKLLAQGKSRKEVARAMKLSLGSVYTYSTNAIQLLGARSLEHACAMAVARGLVDANTVINAGTG